MESVWSVSKLSTESVGSRRELANCVHTADADATKQFCRVGGVYWALGQSCKMKLVTSLEMKKYYSLHIITSKDDSSLSAKTHYTMVVLATVVETSNC